MQNNGDNLNVHMQEGDWFSKACHGHTVEHYEAVEENDMKWFLSYLIK